MPGMYHMLYLEATKRCNFSCPNCSSGSQGDYCESDDMSLDTIVNRILIPAKALGTEYIDFSGGEFLLRKDAFELLEIAHKMGFGLGISSNGSTLTDETLEKINALVGQNMLISLGINSFDEDNSFSRQSTPDFFLKTLERLERHHVRVNVSVTMGEFNKKSFSDTIQKITDLGLPYNRIPYTPRNSSEKSWMFDKAAMKDWLHPVLCSHYKGYVSYVPFFLTKKKYNQLAGTEHNYPVPVEPSVGCWVGSFYAINPAGEVSPCPLLSDHVSGGNVLTTDLKDILFKSELFTRIVDRNNFKGKCGTCKNNYTCGGCRTYAYFLSGDVYESDPTCFIDELSAEELEALENKTAKNFRNYCRMVHFGKKTEE
ncbi:MAG: hypothetical protein CVU05_04445 [Bacteroidetes bacterium HGW-Bacteroidetes-21]|jgi:radical SAM protein with 4Fe4S-binding SPASM domain|nr:MAG: hypothetical protein CVU05_04445 [Bacteroidetes bacterium HGW-Bacteroidetes-21]